MLGVGGKVTSYIPALARVPAASFGDGLVGVLNRPMAPGWNRLAIGFRVVPAG